MISREGHLYFSFPPPCFLARSCSPLLDVDADNSDLIKRFVTLVRPDVLNLVNDLEARSGPTKDAAKVQQRRISFKPQPIAECPSYPPMLVVQPRARDRRDEELGTIGFRTGVGHRQCVRSIVLERWMKLVFEG